MTKLSRDELLAAVLPILAERGFHTATAREVCLQVGVSNGAFFHRFPTWEALGVAAYAALCESLVRSLQVGAEAVGDDAERRVRHFISRWITWFQANQDRARLLIELEGARWSHAAGKQIRQARVSLEDAAWTCCGARLNAHEWSVITGPLETACRRWLLLGRPARLASIEVELQSDMLQLLNQLGTRRPVARVQSPRALTSEGQSDLLESGTLGPARP